MFEREVVCSCLEETLRLASALGGVLRGGDTLALVGELGSGKTTFTRGLARGLGLSDLRLVSSPTYVLEQVYPARVAIHHYDAYRLTSAEEFLALGFEEQIAQGSVLVIEWADRVGQVLPPETLQVELLLSGESLSPERRRLRFSGPADLWEHRLSPVFARASS